MLGGKMDMKVTNCKWCGGKTVNTGTKECDRCWELRHRIENNMELAKMMMAQLNQTINKTE